ncbi:bifunctional Class II Aminoacyl-tRNA synthetase-Biotinyl protein ligase (BPL) and lipoyl protein ligase (LPL)/Class II Histidinyl-tRNA synthetase (HisRS)-like catalytic core domain/Histidine-tRNA ligase-ATP phosphoribosyltransferase regulatory subunit [Babesia duncani]|uniref:histidine--tRNA ligase n=1 Tax=Babesia duncani TaxID=323732 RepID=A0AAD9PKT8_9APIC|nr:bifunctional Class II Aminoacyl-tRNA synthetase-Biotinyl protein ligase (BPL) and lipoyl protein ligase (LPL)/Class II Histidinyl-tRNA synthetase (HisRS)-like catalytic core domain/Histidine-tRNA ligase-ATP phosphoribosyltransferase regulatory subunit [Babesia duncani]
MATAADRKGRELALRGDVTPQFMHMLRRMHATQYPHISSHLWPSNISKWFTIADCWRYERPGLGRRRNHLQWNVDIVGIESLIAEVELLEMLVSFFKSAKLGSHDVVIKISHREIVPLILKHLGVACNSREFEHDFYKLLDKARRLGPDEFATQMTNLLGKEALDRFLELKTACTKPSALMSAFREPGIEKIALDLQSIFEAIGQDWFELDLELVRGNEYYTGIIFEAYNRHLPKSRAIAGGGRYDKYFGHTGIQQLDYAVGFGMGNVQISTILAPIKSFPEPQAHVLVHAPDFEYPALVKLLRALENTSLAVHLNYKVTKMQKAIHLACQLGAKYLIQPDLDSNHSVLVLGRCPPNKWEFENEFHKVPVDKLADFLKC